MENEQMYPYTAKEARERGELEQWRANFRANCACAGAIELAIREDFDGMHLKEDCAKRVIDHYGYKRTAFVLANTLQEHSYDGRYHPTNIQWSQSIYIPPDGDHRYAFMVGSHPAVLDGFVTQYRAELAKLHLFGAETVRQIPVNRTSPVRYWCCRRKCCGKPAGGRRISSGWRGTASAAAPTPEAVRYAVPV